MYPPLHAFRSYKINASIKSQFIYREFKAQLGSQTSHGQELNRPTQCSSGIQKKESILGTFSTKKT